jgi:alpha-ketoglutarate-dependent taurine dioxygenase
MALSREDLTPRIGSMVQADAAMLLSGEYAAELRELLEQRGVLVFRGANLDDEELMAFALTMGEIQGGHTYDGNNIFKVSMDETVNPHASQYMRGTLAWHMDRTDVDIPPLGSILTPRVLSPEGGDTEFANTYAAYDDLSDEDKQRCENLQVIHRTAAQFRKLSVADGGIGDDSWREAEGKTHPLVWQHRSGRKSLVLGWTASEVVGMDRDESEALLDRLMAWSEKPEYTYRHQWQMGDVVMWDNTGTMHRVHKFPFDCGRRLHRVTLLGEEPVRGV